MKIFNRIMAGTMTLLTILGSVACNNTNEQISDPLYQISDVVREDLMWDTETLFNVVPETKKLQDIHLEYRVRNVDCFYRLYFFA